MVRAKKCSHSGMAQVSSATWLTLCRGISISTDLLYSRSSLRTHAWCSAAVAPGAGGVHCIAGMGSCFANTLL